MSAAILPLPHYAFMAWCSFVRSTGTTLPLHCMAYWPQPLYLLNTPSFYSTFVSSFLHTFLGMCARARVCLPVSCCFYAQFIAYWGM